MAQDNIEGCSGRFNRELFSRYHLFINQRWTSHALIITGQMATLLATALSNRHIGTQMSIMHLFHRLPLSRKILIGIVPLFLVFISGSVVLDNHFQEQEMMEQAQLSARTYADMMKESLVSMMVSNLEVDSSFLERVKGLSAFDTLHVLVNDLKLREELRTLKREERLAIKYKTLVAHDDVERKVLATGEPIFQREGDHFRAVVPFNATTVCQKCHEVPVGYTLGATDLHISLERISQAVAGNWKRSLLIFLAFTALAIAVASVMFTRFISRPIERLVTATRQISAGNLDYELAATYPRHLEASGTNGVQSSDELVYLAVRFDEMRKSLKEKIDQLDHVNRSLSDRNVEVEQALRRLRQAQEDLVRSERLAVTGKMTAQLSHEINNPIHNIQSLLESSLRKVNGNSQARELISVALEEVTRMARLTRQMLEFYRGSVLEIKHELVDMKEVVAELVRANEGQLAKQSITVELDMPSCVPLVQGSRDKLKQVLLNLILNARDAMPKGGKITMKVQALHNMVRIEVTDTGVGIHPENMGKIFDAFFTTKKEVSGVGLGLSVSYGIVQQHRGTITVASKVGEGATFTVQLPVAGELNG
jgi:signal transduction histidine kinase